MNNTYLLRFTSNLKLFAGTENFNEFVSRGCLNPEGLPISKNSKIHIERLKKFFEYHKLDKSKIEIRGFLQESRCLCRHPITMCYLIQKRGEYESPFIVVGSCCIKKFNEQRLRKNCLNCDLPYQSHNDICAKCRKLPECEKCNKRKIKIVKGICQECEIKDKLCQYCNKNFRYKKTAMCWDCTCSPFLNC